MSATRPIGTSDHGDVCRAADGGFSCPEGCVVAGTPPYCSKDASPCRVAAAAGELLYRCDPGGGERGVCIVAAGHAPPPRATSWQLAVRFSHSPSVFRHPHFTGDATHAHPDCGGECAKPAPACASDEDCSLAGECDAATGTCVCDAWASGADCSLLALEAVDPARLGFLPREHSTWGGSVRRGGDGRWHMLASEIACPAGAQRTRCGLGGWKTDSRLVHAVSSDPAGPYERTGLAMGGSGAAGGTYGHNPSLHASADGSWHLFYISGWSGPISVRTASRLDDGTSWSEPTVVSPHENPGPLLHANGPLPPLYRSSANLNTYRVIITMTGSLTLLYRSSAELPAPSCSAESIGAQQCELGGAEGKRAGCGPGRNPVIAHTAEDPSAFVDRRGRRSHVLSSALPRPRLTPPPPSAPPLCKQALPHADERAAVGVRAQGAAGSACVEPRRRELVGAARRRL